MNKELIMKLIERAKDATENSYCPYTRIPLGCSLLVDDNMIFSGCNIESFDLATSVDAGTVAVTKAISEGHTKFLTICLWAERIMPYPGGVLRQVLMEFCPKIQIIVANEETFSVLALNDIYPLPPSPLVDIE